MTRADRLAHGLAALLLFPLSAAVAQSTVARATVAPGAIARRVDAVRDGTVRMSFAARDGVCGNGNGWYRTRSGGNGITYNNWSSSRDVEYACDAGPVRLAIVRKQGETTELRTSVGGTWRADTGVTDLGTVSATEAGRWLLTVAEHEADAPARNALHALTITDSVNAWPDFLRIAKDDKRSKEVRNQALFWLGEFAGEKTTAALDSMAYEPGDREVRKQAIYALSRRPVDEAVPTLLRMAETLPDRELRKTAIFWLSRTNDPRALAWLSKALENK